MELSFFEIILIILAVAIIMHFWYHSNAKIEIDFKHSATEEMENVGIEDTLTSSGYAGAYSYGGNGSFRGSHNPEITERQYSEELSSVDSIDGADEIADRQLTKIRTIGGSYTGNTQGDVYLPEEKKFDMTPTPAMQKEEALKELERLQAMRSSDDLALEENVQNVKRYIRDYVLNGLNECECVPDKSQPDFSPEEIDAYREKHIQFRENVFGTSKGIDGIDPVDKMNQVAYNGGIPANGMTIAQFYDKIADSKVSNVSNNFVMGTNIPKNKCVMPPRIDNHANGGPAGFYTGMGSGKYFKSDMWEYQNENPNNGGSYYDNIMGDDPLIGDDTNMIIN